MGSPRQAQHKGSTPSCRNALSNGFDTNPGKNRVANMVHLADLTAVVFTDDPNADLTGDGVVNFADLAKMKSVFFKTCAPWGHVASRGHRGAAAVPALRLSRACCGSGWTPTGPSPCAP